MFDTDKDMMKEITRVLAAMSDKEKARRAQRLQQLMQSELAKRKLINKKKPKKN